MRRARAGASSALSARALLRGLRTCAGAGAGCSTGRGGHSYVLPLATGAGGGGFTVAVAVGFARGRFGAGITAGFSTTALTVAGAGAGFSSTTTGVALVGAALDVGASFLMSSAWPLIAR